jgi:pantothenate kinase
MQEVRGSIPLGSTNSPHSRGDRPPRQGPCGRPPLTRTVTLGELAAALAAAQGPGRRVVAVAGAPGSGKSTFAERLRDALPPGIAAEVLPMDGYHYDDVVLEARGDRPRKGAPQTFDVDGLAAMLARLRADDGRPVAVPVFDRAIEIARAAARIIPPETRLVIVEGNYLLLDDPDWSRLRPLFDATVFLRVPEDVLADRLADRWQGYGMDAAGIRAKLEDNDLPNGRLVTRGSAAADFEVANV